MIVASQGHKKTSSARPRYTSFLFGPFREVVGSDLLELEAMCPLCPSIFLISDFTSNAREARCPGCLYSFDADPGNLVQVPYARASLGT